MLNRNYDAHCDTHKVNHAVGELCNRCFIDRHLPANYVTPEFENLLQALNDCGDDDMQNDDWLAGFQKAIDCIAAFGGDR